MPRWWLLVTSNWRVKPARAAGTVVAIALGVATVVWVTSSYESVRRSLSDRITDQWVGASHLSIESPLGHWGQIDDSVLDLCRESECITHITPRLRRRMSVPRPTKASPDAVDDLTVSAKDLEVDVVGIDPATEYEFRSYDVQGQLLTPTDHGSTVAERAVLDELNLKLGDTIRIELYPSGPSAPFKIVGVFDARRVAKFQRPMLLVALDELQTLTGQTHQLTSVDIIINNPTPAHVDLEGNRLREKLLKRGLGYQVVTSSSRLKRLDEAQKQSGFALTYVAGVALLTAFFIIATTMSMGVVERIRQLGVLRCIGMTRSQLRSLVMAEAVPITLVGLAVGVPIGIALTWLGASMVPQYIQGVIVSGRGIVVALLGGALTALVAALLPAWHAGRISPLDATRPQAEKGKTRWPVVAAVVGLVLVGTYQWMVEFLAPFQWFRASVVVTGDVLLFTGYGLMTPLAVGLIGRAAVWVTSPLLRIHRALMRDQVAGAAWRGAGVCCGLMVGLSLLIGVVVYSASLRAGWDFPAGIAQAFVWARDRMPRSAAEAVRHVPGVSSMTIVSDFLCEVGEPRSRLLSMFKVRSAFVAGEPEVFLNMTQLDFLEGDFDDALAKLKRGGYLLVPPEASRAFELHYGDRVPITVGNTTVQFEIAGVVQSPALDIAVGYFQAESYMMLAAAGSVLGTLDDAKKDFGVDRVSLILANFDLPETEPPAVFASQVPPRVTNEFLAKALTDWGDRLTNDRDELKHIKPILAGWLAGEKPVADVGVLLRRYRQALRFTAENWAGATAQQRWDLFCDQLLMLRIVQTIDRPGAIFGSLRQLKQQIDDDIREATLLLAAIPVVALIVAAIGVGNLMTANVLNRRREIGILRSNGATRGQIMRLVLGEAVVLGAIGCAIGVTLGLHGAVNANRLTERMIGFAPQFAVPWPEVTAGIALTAGVCILAGIAPARRAAGTNVVQAIEAA